MGNNEHLIVERHGNVGWPINDRADVVSAMISAVRDRLTDAGKVGAQHLGARWRRPDRDEGPEALAEKREPTWLV